MESQTNVKEFDNSPRGQVTRAVQYAKKDIKAFTDLMRRLNIEVDADAALKEFTAMKLEFIQAKADSYAVRKTTDEELIASFL